MDGMCTRTLILSFIVNLTKQPDLIHFLFQIPEYPYLEQQGQALHCPRGMQKFTDETTA